LTRFNKPNNLVPSALKRRNASRNKRQRRVSKLFSKYVSSLSLFPLLDPLLVHRTTTYVRRQGAKLEIDSILRETCDRVLNDSTITREKAVLRAGALQILGNAFMAVRNEREEARDDSEYVRVETKTSRQRAQSRTFPGQ
jgi:X-domain of DnaJ-containing